MINEYIANAKCTGHTNEELSKLATLSKNQNHSWKCKICSTNIVSTLDQKGIYETSDVEKRHFEKIQSLFQKYCVPVKIGMQKKLKPLQDRFDEVIQENMNLRKKIN